MKRRTSFSLTSLAVALTLGACSSSAAQDAAVADPEHYRIAFENDAVRVLRVRYGPGERGVMHAHPAGVLVFLTDGEGTFTSPDGSTQTFRWRAGESERVPAMAHLPGNTGEEAYELLFVEIKAPAAVASAPGAPAAEERRLPIIDMHLHASLADENGPPPLGLCLPMTTYAPAFEPSASWGEVFLAAFEDPPCPDPIWSPLTDEAVMEETIEVLERRNIVGVLSGPPDRVLRWVKAAPNRFIPSVQLQIGRDAYTLDSLRALFEGGPFAVLGEVSNQYAGIAPDDERMEPYWTLAESLDVPVAIHMGEGPTGAAALLPTYRARLSSPYLLEEVLARHPRLRISIMHYGSPLIDETIAMLGAYPQLYVDLGGIQWFYPRDYFYAQLRQLIDAGFGKRVMFGSDQLAWPGVIEPAIAVVEEAPFLSEEQKRDILYNNAARFLRLTEQEIARHHGK